MPALGDEPALAEITMSKGRKGPHTVAFLDNGEREVTTQSWKYAVWKRTNFSVRTRRMSWYPESAVKEERICRGSPPWAGLSFSTC